MRAAGGAVRLQAAPVKSAAGWMVATLSLIAAAPAFAEEAGGGANVFAGDVGNAIWTLLIFGLLLVVLGKYAWGPILTGLQKREQFIRDSLEQARRDRDAAEARLHEYEEKLASAHREVAAIIETGRRDAAALAHKLQDEARQESERTLARTRQEIERAKVAASKELFATAAKLATQLASRILEREIKPADYERLLAESIREIDEAARLERGAAS
jgi:F-type H+-transporting ATPase subunit b